MSLTKEHLQNTFNTAKENGVDYVFVAIIAEGVEEVIVIPKQSFDAKKMFYLEAYNNELIHVMNKNVYIRDLSYGSCYELENII